MTGLWSIKVLGSLQFSKGSRKWWWGKRWSRLGSKIDQTDTTEFVDENSVTWLNLDKRQISTGIWSWTNQFQCIVPMVVYTCVSRTTASAFQTWIPVTTIVHIHTHTKPNHLPPLTFCLSLWNFHFYRVMFIKVRFLTAETRSSQSRLMWADTSPHLITGWFESESAGICVCVSLCILVLLYLWGHILKKEKKIV